MAATLVIIEPCDIYDLLPTATTLLNEAAVIFSGRSEKQAQTPAHHKKACGKIDKILKL
jgi:hypothetical protein